MPIPEHVNIAIRQKASFDWPGDYSMQLHFVESQTQAFMEMSYLQSSMDQTNEVTATCLKKAISDWSDDYEMQLHVFHEQLNSAFAFFEFSNPGMPESVLEGIKIAAFSEWAGDYVMMKHYLEEQTNAWLTLNP